MQMPVEKSRLDRPGQMSRETIPEAIPETIARGHLRGRRMRPPRAAWKEAAVGRFGTDRLDGSSLETPSAALEALVAVSVSVTFRWELRARQERGGKKQSTDGRVNTDGIEMTEKGGREEENAPAAQSHLARAEKQERARGGNL